MSASAPGASADAERRQRAPGNSILGDVWITFVRWVRKTIRNPYLVVGALFTPVLLLVLFTELFGEVTVGPLQSALGEDVSYITYLVPAVAILSAMDAAAYSGMGLVEDIESGMFEKTLVAPIHRSAIVFGKTLADVLQILVQTGLILVIGYAALWIDTGGAPGPYVRTGAVGVLAIGLVVVLFSLWYAAFSNIVALVTRDGESTSLWTNVFQLPLLFVSTAFLPADFLPGWMKLAATVNPVTYGVEAVRAIVLGQDTLSVLEVSAFGGLWDTLGPALAVIIGLDLVLGGIAAVFFHRATSASVQGQRTDV